MDGPSGEEKSRVMVTNSTGYCYSDVSSNVQTHLVSQLQSFESNPEIYNLTAGMEMIGFPSKNLNQQTENTAVFWKGFFNKLPGTKAINEPTSSEFYQTDFSKQQDLTAMSDTTNETLMVSPDTSSAWSHHQQQQHHQNRLLVEDPSLRCVFPSEGNERPIHGQGQGLSLCLSSSNNPSSIGLQSFELRENDDLRFGPSNSRSINIQHEQPQQMMQLGAYQIRNSKYLEAAQELLKEFCNLEIEKPDETSKLKAQKSNEWHDKEDAIKKQSLYSLDLLELQKRKTKLLQMLEEVDRRYKHYCNQMKAVVSSFEAVAGNGAAMVYSAMASRAMSRHFRCLKDGIISQIKATKKAMGDKDTAAPGTTKGETPRLKLLDQTLRQQKAFQQMNMMETHPWRPQRGLPERSVSVLRAWLFEHFLHPYPSDVDKHILARQTGLSRSQVSNWFINARVRLWKPMVEEMYLEDQKDNVGALEGANLDSENNYLKNQNPDQKPTQDQLIRIESECLSSIIHKKTLHHSDHPSSERVVEDYSNSMQFDFSSYGHHSAGATVSYLDENPAARNSYDGGGGGVSLTLGLHQHGGASGLGFAPASQQQSSLFYPRSDQMEECQTVHQYSLLDGENHQNLPYRNLMGAQLLHDLAG